MNRKWFGIAALITIAISLLSVSSCGDPQTLQSITVVPATVTFGSSNIPVGADAGLTTQLRALGNYLHPPVTKDITDQVTWASSDNQMVTVNSTGLTTATGVVCGTGTVISATVNTNSDAGGVSASGAIVTGSMTANVTCFTGNGSGSSEPTLALSFAGTGTGTITSSPAGINCPSTQVNCVASFPTGTGVTLTATPVGSSVFGGYSGGCTGSTCTIDMESDTAVVATFN